MNQKSWHPLSQRNQQRLCEAEKKHQQDVRRREERRIELEKESEKLKQALVLNPNSKEDRDVARGKVNLSFMYTKPPGLEEAETRSKAEERSGPREGNPRGACAGGRDRRDWRRRDPHPLESSSAPAETSVDAPHHHRQRRQDLKYELKYEYGKRSPIRGGLDPDADNQQFLASEDEAVCDDDGDEVRERKRRHKHRHRSGSRRDDGGTSHKRRRRRRSSRRSASPSPD